MSLPTIPSVRADLHCHSSASSEAGEALLSAINCPESFSEPSEVYAQAKRRGMNFVTITDHDSIAGLRTLSPTPDLLFGEELTCYFPEDRCKMHVLVWGIGQKEHDALQAIADDIYKVAAYIELNRIAHAVAHPVYRQNDRLELWHLERLLLLFKGFECLNGAHSLLHREAFEPLVTELTPQRIAELASKHGLEPHWPQPWRKARTGGSDDHGLFNIGRTWTEFPADVNTIDKLLECLREGRCQPGGEAGSSLKLAHNFYSVGIRYSKTRLSRKPTASMAVLEAMIGQRPLRKRDIVKAAVKGSVSAVGRRLRRNLGRRQENSGTALLNNLFCNSIGKRIHSHPSLIRALRNGEAPLAEHEAMFKLLAQVTRDTTAGTVESIIKGVAGGKVAPIFDALSTVACQQFMLMPYYFALFHQNRERHLLPRLTGRCKPIERQTMRLGVFTDTFDEMNGVSRFLRTLGNQAQQRGRSLTIHTCAAGVNTVEPFRKNFEPLISMPFPGYPQLPLSLPPVAEVLEWADRQQFDAIHVHTPGPMGLCGMLVASMLRVPLLSTYHTDFPAYVLDHTGDHRLTTTAESFMSWFFGRSERVFTRSHQYEKPLGRLGIDPNRVMLLPACVDSETFNPRHRDPNFWHDRGIRGATHHLLYCGRISFEKNLMLLARAYRQLCRDRNDLALIFAGDGPQVCQLQQELRDLPVWFLGRQNDAQLSGLYANSDLLLFPSKTDTLGQVVLEAQASGLPVLVSDQGGPKEVVDDGLTGLVLAADDASAWSAAVDQLLRDEPRRLRMSRTAPLRMVRCGAARTFEAYWDEHHKAACAAAERHAGAAVPPSQATQPARAVELVAEPAL
jgi:glycosyltransferase involved in cell wall biosynthesis